MKLSTHTPLRRDSHNSGFSLVELLTTICILGVLAGIAITNMSSATDSVRETRNKRNAQELVSTCMAAQAVGLDFIVGNNLDQTISKIMAGEKATTGAFAGRTFGVKNLAASDVAGAKQHLSLGGGQLLYHSARVN